MQSARAKARCRSRRYLEIVIVRAFWPACSGAAGSRLNLGRDQLDLQGVAFPQGLDDEQIMLVAGFARVEQLRGIATASHRKALPHCCCSVVLGPVEEADPGPSGSGGGLARDDQPVRMKRRRLMVEEIRGHHGRALRIKKSIQFCTFILVLDDDRIVATERQTGAAVLFRQIED